MVFLAGLLPASCHKTAPQQKTAPPAVAADHSGNASAAMAQSAARAASCNLGELALTNHSEICLQLSNGEICNLTPKMLDKRNVQITLAVESKNEYGETRDFSATQVVGPVGKPLAATVGDLNFTFTPQISVE